MSPFSHAFSAHFPSDKTLPSARPQLSLARKPFDEGAEFDGFRIGQPLGAGGMEDVYLAEEVSLRRRVALKFLRAPSANCGSLLRREAQALAQVMHPNVATIFRVGEDAGRPYIAYEYVEGTSLERLPLPLSFLQVLGLARGMALGLAAIHARGVVHGDIQTRECCAQYSRRGKNNRFWYRLLS